ncbi:hypothetical protein DSO57_1018901 [Entomophthora muscae]|uniref:Uncharacterized protein n=1 Tax=Entomophthora muscae TaxID=34485 RepID=A0ACC2TRT3_9FUNG|nr:hypothetical protein DSO57_1018901 [Entomophthora muscae]
MIENITTQEIESNHQSVDHNKFPNHTTAALQCNSLLFMEATQLTPSNSTIIKTSPDATVLVSSHVPCQDSLNQSTVTAQMNPHSQAQAKVPGSLSPLFITLQVPVTKGWATGTFQKAASSLFKGRPDLWYKNYFLQSSQVQKILNKLYVKTIKPLVMDYQPGPSPGRDSCYIPPPIIQPAAEVQPYDHSRYEMVILTFLILAEVVVPHLGA